SWNVMNSGTTQLLTAIHFPNSTTGWAVGYGGTILKYDLAATGVNDSPKNDLTVSVYPNPVSDFAFIKINSLEINKLQLNIFDMFGKKIDASATCTWEGFILNREGMKA